MTMRYFCCDERRREAILQPGINLNGIDYLEVLDQAVPAGIPQQQILLVRCFRPISSDLTANNIQIDGGERITAIQVLWAFPASSIPENGGVASEEREFLESLAESLLEPDRVLIVRTHSPGDFSTYRLSFVRSPDDSSRPNNFDPILRSIAFSFKVECPSEFDCQIEKVCPPEPLPQPDINYLAKDYASFRQLMLDRMSLLSPQWKERNPADMGIALVELLAYVGDRFSYQQDAIATEAYLGTARRRISVRRHARLVDYSMHDGCNARTWVQIAVNAPIERPSADAPSPIPKGTQLLTRVPMQSVRIAPNSSAYQQALQTAGVIFEIAHDVEGLYPLHNQISFYTWGAVECCLPKGATRATLRGSFPNLKERDILIFEEVLDSNTGAQEDADPTHRHVVSLTSVEFDEDPLFLDSGNPIAVTHISWDTQDALPFPICISTATVAEVSVALGNIVLADHGRKIEEKPIRDGRNDRVPKSKFDWITPMGDRCNPPSPDPVPPRFFPRLQESPLTQAISYNSTASAWATMHRSVADALPEITLQELDTNNQPDLTRPIWKPRRDLLNSGQDDAHFVVETEVDGSAFLRFGDEQHGDRPEPETAFLANYRIGNGVAGNIGADALAHIVLSDSAVIGIRNPLSAQGGQEPESIAEVRQRAPFAFRTQKRAVTPEDYAKVTERLPEVQRAATTLRWTGSWYTVFVTVDRLGGQPIDDEFKQQVRQHLDLYRMAGQDVQIDAPRFVSLEIEMRVCVKPDYFRSDVKKALLEVFSDRILPNGQRGVFHPDNFTFGQPVYLSPLYAAALAVLGVATVEIRVFQRQGTDSIQALQSGKLEIGRLEIARLENDPNFIDHGTIELIMEGGK